MIQDLFVLNGYGQFVWPAFMFTFLSCLKTLVDILSGKNEKWVSRAHRIQGDAFPDIFLALSGL